VLRERFCVTATKRTRVQVFDESSAEQLDASGKISNRVFQQPANHSSIIENPVSG
jgi:hypothetical protein